MKRHFNEKSKIALTAFCLWGLVSACALSDIVNVDKPQTGSEIDHDYLDTRSGSLSLLYSTLGSLQNGVSRAALQVGVFTDELTARPENSQDNVYFGRTRIDPRVEHEVSFGLKGLPFDAYNDLQATRARAGHARYFMKRQVDTTLNYAISAAYSYEGYAIMMLAENLCSGIPLSEALYGQDAVYGKALPSDSLFLIAVSKFDSALALNYDSLRFRTLAQVGKARALTSLGRYKEAASAVSDIQQADVYNLQYTQMVTPGQTLQEPADAFWTTTVSSSARTSNQGHEIINREGGNGMVWFSNTASPDPRLPLSVDGLVVRQSKFPTGAVSFKLASWIDAKMIEAEYLLSIDDLNWIEPINAARRTINLPDTVSPATFSEKIDLLFRERALWFYGQATRLSDMRRLVRQYGRSVNSVFPVGGYTRAYTIFAYGDAVVFIPNVEEFRNNYNYSGCINRNP